MLSAKVMARVIERAVHIHGALGVTNEMDLVQIMLGGLALGLADGPTEVHKDNLARKLLKNYRPSDDEFFPNGHLPRRMQAALDKFGDLVDIDSIPHW